MAAGQIQSVGFTSPYAAEESDIERRRKLAEMLQAESLKDDSGTQMIGGWAIPRSPFESLSKALKGPMAQYMGKEADEKQKALAEKYQSDYRTMVAKGLRELSGTPAQPGGDYEDSMGIGRSNPGQPAQAADPMSALATFGSHPQGAALMPLAMQQIQREQMIKALRAGAQGAGQAATAGAQAGPQGAGMPLAPPGVPQQAMGGPAGGQPMEVWLSTDPSGKSYVEQLAKDFTERGKPVINRGYGVGTMNAQGQFVPDAASVAQAKEVEEMKAGIHAGYAPPVSIPMSGGQSASVFPPEFKGIRETGQPPARLGGQPPAGAVPVPQAGGAPMAVVGNAPTGEQVNMREGWTPAELQRAAGRDPQTAAALQGMGVLPQGSRPVPQAGPGTLGLTQPQPDVINQARQTAAGKALDEQFAKDYATFVQGGAADSAKQLAQLKDVITALGKPGAKLTGPFIGSAPDALLKFTNPNSIAARERVEEVVQRSLRAVLGAQFTEKEGERLIARAYNPNLKESENKVRVQRLYTQLEQAFNAKQDAARYFEKNGTLDGWKGKLPSIADFDLEGTGATREIAPRTRNLLDKYAPENQ